MAEDRIRLYLDIPYGVKMFLRALAVAEDTSVNHLVLRDLAAAHPELQPLLSDMLMQERARQLKTRAQSAREDKLYEEADAKAKAEAEKLKQEN